MRRLGQGMAAWPGLWAVLALAAYWLVEAGAERIYLGTWDLGPSAWGVQWMAARLGMDLAALALGLGLIRRWDRILPGLAVVYGLGLIGLVAAWHLWMQDPDDWTLGPARVALYAAPVGIGLAALVWRAGAAGRGPGAGAGAGGPGQPDRRRPLFQLGFRADRTR